MSIQAIDWIYKNGANEDYKTTIKVCIYIYIYIYIYILVCVLYGRYVTIYI